MSPDSIARLLRDADEWNQVAHEPTPFSCVPGFSPSRVYVDMLHTLDLACTTDTLASMLVVCSRGVDAKLASFRDDYFKWCRDSRISEKAHHKLFTMKILQPKNEYPSLSQKMIKAAASRMMTYWACNLAYAYAMENSDDPRAEILSCAFRHFSKPIQSVMKHFAFLRIMANCLLGLVGIYTAVATAGRWMNNEELAELQQCYFLWRTSYNRPMDKFGRFNSLGSCSLGLASV